MTKRRQIGIVNRSGFDLPESQDYDRILDRNRGCSSCVPMGEASHGTYEFYEYRADITKRLIAEKGFRAVAARSRQRGEASSGMEAWLDRVMAKRTCPDCKGARLRATRLLFTARFTSDCLLKGFHRLFPSERFCFYRLQVVKKVLF